MVDGMVQMRFNSGADLGYCWGELEERWRRVSWVPVNWVTFRLHIGKSDNDLQPDVEGRYRLPSVLVYFTLYCDQARNLSPYRIKGN